MSCFLPSYTIIIFLIGFFVCYIFILCKPSWNKTMFINPEMLQIDSFGYSILLEIYGKSGRY